MKRTFWVFSFIALLTGSQLALAQADPTLKRCDSLPKFELMDCRQALEGAFSKKILALEIKIKGHLSLIDRDYGAKVVRWPNGNRIDFVSDFDRAQMLWREFSTLDCQSLVPDDFESSIYGNDLQRCILGRFAARIQTLEARVRVLRNNRSRIR
jgi:hypothetical protein